ncbi:hypothetical protein M0805_009275 [Coniferiporia weirii]|nr:hypothetical protein M0805_009275 [Coniferiporia weirii]
MENGTILAYLGSHPDCDLLQLVLHIAEGIDYLHYKGIIHSDIKPENILISSSGEPRICDFGISRMFADLGSLSLNTTTGGIGGTVRYMSVELLAQTDQQPDTYSEASDVWAFGITVLALLTKKPPYSHIKHDFGVVSAIASGVVPLIPEEYGKTWPKHYPDLWELCIRCWASLPSGRPSMFGIVIDLRVLHNSQAVEGPRVLSVDDIHVIHLLEHSNGARASRLQSDGFSAWLSPFSDYST